MPFKNCTICEEFMPDGTKVLRVTGKLICQADRHAFNAKVDQLAPSKETVEPNQTYIIDISKANMIAVPGLEALRYAANRFVAFGGQVAICADKKLIISEWYAHIPFNVPVFASFQDAANSFKLKTETTDGRHAD